MKESREKVIKAIIYYQQNLERYSANHEDAKMLHCINRLQGLQITVSHLEETGVGRTVNSLRKISGEVGDAARTLVNKWKGMVEQDGDDDDEDTNKDKANVRSHKEKDKHSSSHYSDKHKSSSKDKHKDEDKKRHRDKTHSSEDKDRKKDERHRDHKLKLDKDIKKEVLDKDEMERDSSSKRKHKSVSSEEEGKYENQIKLEQEIKKEILSSDDERHKRDDKYRSKSEKDSNSDSKRRTDKYKSKNDKNESSSSSKRKHKSDTSDEENPYRNEKIVKKELLNSDVDRKHKLLTEKEIKKEKIDHSKRKHNRDSSDEDKYQPKTTTEKISNGNKYTNDSDDDAFPNDHLNDNDSGSDSHENMKKQHSSHKSMHNSESEEEYTKSKHLSKKIKNEQYSDNESDLEDTIEKKKQQYDVDMNKLKLYAGNSDNENDEEKRKSKKSKHKEKSSAKYESNSKHSKSDSKRREHKDKKDKSPEKISKNESKTTVKSNEDKKNDSKSHKSSTSKKTVSVLEGIDSGSGASFAEALGMLLPSTSTAKTPNKAAPKKKPFGTPEKSSIVEKSPYITADRKADKLNFSLMERPAKKVEPIVQIPSTLTNPNKLEPLDINISSLLPPISTNYRPLGNNLLDAQNKKVKDLNDTEELSKLMYAKNARTKVYSGNKALYNTVPSLFELCTRVLQVNIDALEYTGGVPYCILKPVLDRATPDQLFILEHHNPYIIDDSDELWEIHCKKEFRNKLATREELESWREMYMRCLDEREAKLKALTANIKLSQDKSIPIRQTKLAYVDSVVKPPRNVAKKQVRNGIEKRPTITPSARLSNIATSGAAGMIAVPNPGRASASSNSSSNSSFSKVKKAPLMQKTLQLMKGRFRR